MTETTWTIADLEAALTEDERQLVSEIRTRFSATLDEHIRIAKANPSDPRIRAFVDEEGRLQREINAPLYAARQRMGW